MDNEEVEEVSICHIDEEVLQEQDEESQLTNGSKSNRSVSDEKDEPESSLFKENSVVTLTSMSGSSQTIKVYLRLKPFPSEIDLTKEQEDAYTIVDSTTLLTKIPGLDVNSRSLKNLKASERVCRTFTFTTAFGPTTSQAKLFDAAIKDQLRDFLAGQSSTVMSYGTSNAGKSFTLYGVPTDLGIIPLCIDFLFRTVESALSMPWFKPIHQNHVVGLSSTERVHELEMRDKLLSFTSPEKMEFVNAYQTIRDTTSKEEADSTSRQNQHFVYSVWISFAEIYNDAIYDLLSSDCQKKRLPLKMVTDKQGRTFIKDLRMVYVNSGEEAYRVLLTGQYRTRIAATTLNPRSSRSHCIFTVKLLKYYAASSPEDVEVSALSFCDLAGSGRLKMTTNISDRLKETQNINTSLLVLGRCLKAIWEGQSVRQKSEPIGPFRESKLTRLFQKALSGKEPITLIVNVNPVPYVYAETQNVLNFSAIAKKIIVEPVREDKKKTFTTRFSRVVSQSVKTVTDWDHAAVNDSVTNEIDPDKFENSNYILRECYDDLAAEYKNLKTEYMTLKSSTMNRDNEIRAEMANTYAGLINDLENNWRSRSKDAEEQQEHLLAWSVNQVENFYKEKLNRLKSRKRRRWDDGDTAEDREADIREIETQNASLAAKILVSKETIKELRAARENAIAEKNKAVFELSLVREEMIGVKSLLEAAENDIRRNEDGAHFTDELRKQLNTREERIKNLKEFLNEAKEEYIRITSDARQMHEELKEANASLIENAEKIEDLEDQLDQNDVCLEERGKEMEQLAEKFELQSKQLAACDERARKAEEELSKSESIRLNLMGAVEDLNKLHNIACTRAPQNFYNTRNLSDDFKDYVDDERNITGVAKEEIMEDVGEAESGNSCGIATNEILENTISRDSGMGNFTDSINEKEDLTDLVKNRGSLDNETETSFKFNDSGIVVSVCSEDRTMDQINRTVDTDLGSEDRNQTSFGTNDGENSDDKQLANLQLRYGDLRVRSLYEAVRVNELSDKLEDANREIANSGADFRTSNERAMRYRVTLESIEKQLRLLNANKLAREEKFSDIIAHLEAKVDEYEEKMGTFQKESKARQDQERFYFESLNDKITGLEKQMSKVRERMETEATRCCDKHEMKIEKLEKEVSALKTREDVSSQLTNSRIDETLKQELDVVTELKHRLSDFENAVAKCQTQEEDQHKQLLDNVERLTLLESQIQNWPIRELKNTSVISTLRDKLKSNLETSFSPAGTESSHVHFSSEYQEQHDKIKVPSRNDEVSPTKIDLLAASTPTTKRASSHSDVESTSTGFVDDASISSSTSAVDPCEGKSQITAKKLFKDDRNSEPREVHTILRGREVAMIMLLFMIHLFELF